MQLSGAEGTGKRFLLKKLGEQAEFVAVSLGFLLERKCVRRDLREIISYCVLRRKYVGLRQLPESLEPEMLGYFLRLLTEYIPVVCVMTETPLRISASPSALPPIPEREPRSACRRDSTAHILSPCSPR